MRPHRVFSTVISAADAAAGDVLFIDCRYRLDQPDAGRAAFERSRIAGARFVDLERDLSDLSQEGRGRHPLPPPERVLDLLEDLGACGRDVVAYDDASGAFAARFWWLCHWVGHRECAVLDGGLAAWLEANLPLDEAPAKPDPIRTWAEPEPRAAVETHMAVVDADEVARRSEAGGTSLIDAREPERHAGLAEPIDPVRGRIPGAVNHYWRDNLDADGRFLEAGRLREKWLERLESAPEETIVYCGSGVTACHDLLAMAHAGLLGAALYPGSWSEWCTDPDRPIEADPVTTTDRA